MGRTAQFLCRLRLCGLRLRVLLSPSPLREHERHVLEGELLPRRQLRGLEPPQLVHVVGRLRLAADRARGPVEVERRLRGRVAAVTVHPDAEEVERLDLEAGLLAQLAPQTV